MDQAPNPIPSYIATVIRTVLGFLAGIMVSKGVVDASQSDALVGAALTLVPIIWGVIQKVNAHKDLQAAIEAPVGSDGK